MTVIVQHSVLWNHPVEYRIESFYDYPDLSFMDDKSKLRVEKALLSGELQSFCVRVDCIIYDVILGTDWLSGCLYTDLDDFINNVEYYEDMVRNAKAMAVDKIRALKSISVPPL